MLDQEPAHGFHADDITSHCNFHKSWTFDKNTILDRHGNNVLCIDERPEGFKPQRSDGHMTYRHHVHGNLVVIDQNNHPVRNFADVPRVLSSEIEGWRIEGIQRTTGMTIYEYVGCSIIPML